MEAVPNRSEFQIQPSASLVPVHLDLSYSVDPAQCKTCKGGHNRYIDDTSVDLGDSIYPA